MKQQSKSTESLEKKVSEIGDKSFENRNEKVFQINEHEGSTIGAAHSIEVLTTCRWACSKLAAISRIEDRRIEGAIVPAATW